MILLIGGGKAYFHGDGRYIGCRVQEETSRARIRLDPSSPVSVSSFAPVTIGLKLAPVTTGLELVRCWGWRQNRERHREERQRRKEEAAANRLDSNRGPQIGVDEFRRRRVLRRNRTTVQSCPARSDEAMTRFDEVTVRSDDDEELKRTS
ncbi:hypothetical protein DY000_02016084 [Brassica cretica]|uniref:Uncharacterized protein n=1 Tax=Brassica cretica TaxID=69181 RepID=A0ABQ7CLW8_BRACR|nr:hypothetical protein DY000_02016084 [Brassica cretica]